MSLCIKFLLTYLLTYHILVVIIIVLYYSRYIVIRLPSWSSSLFIGSNHSRYHQ